MQSKDIPLEKAPSPATTQYASLPAQQVPPPGPCQFLLSYKCSLITPIESDRAKDLILSFCLKELKFRNMNVHKPARCAVRHKMF